MNGVALPSKRGQAGIEVEPLVLECVQTLPEMIEVPARIIQFDALPVRHFFDAAQTSQLALQMFDVCAGTRQFTPQAIGFFARAAQRPGFAPELLQILARARQLVLKARGLVANSSQCRKLALQPFLLSACLLQFGRGPGRIFLCALESGDLCAQLLQLFLSCVIARHLCVGLLQLHAQV